jgi:serine/threonine protein kinase
MMIVLEFAARGDLRTFLMDCRPTKAKATLLSMFDLAKMAVDVANGMVFLSSLNFVHRDLAARYVYTRTEY